MGLFKSKERKWATQSVVLVHVEGLAYNSGMLVNLFTGRENLSIGPSKNNKKNPISEYTLSYDQITNADIINKQQIISGSKDPLGGAILGGLLLGGLGAIIGAASSTGTYESTVNNEYVVVNYIPDGDSEPKALSFQILNGDRLYKSWVRDLANEIRFRIGLPDMEKKKKAAEIIKL